MSEELDREVKVVLSQHTSDVEEEEGCSAYVITRLEVTIVILSYVLPARELNLFYHLETRCS